MREFLTTAQLGKMLGITGDAVKRRIYAGKYILTKRDEPGKGGKRAWLISIYDPAIPDDIRDLFNRQTSKTFGLPAIEDVQRLARVLEGYISLMRENNNLLKSIAEKLEKANK